ncbi:MAG: hypothetical protein ACXAC7_21080, partial [Candidatus Hodarchaeales archaeon]
MPICEKCSQPYHSSLDKCPNCFEDYEKQPQESLINSKKPEFENIILKPLKIPTSKYLVLSGTAIFIGSIVIQVIAFWSFMSNVGEGENSHEIGDFIGNLGNFFENYTIGIMWIFIIAISMGYFYGVGIVLSGILVLKENYSLLEYLGWIDPIYDINEDGISSYKYYSKKLIIKIPWNYIKRIKFEKSMIWLTLNKPINDSTLELINIKKYTSKEELKLYALKIEYNWQIKNSIVSKELRSALKFHTSGQTNYEKYKKEQAQLEFYKTSNTEELKKITEGQFPNYQRYLDAKAKGVNNFKDLCLIEQFNAPDLETAKKMYLMKKYE